MANFFNLTLDTTGVVNPTIVIESGSAFANQQLVNLTIGCGDSNTTGYQMKLWGSVDETHDTNVKTIESGSSWTTYNTSKQIKLSSGEGSKTIYLKVRDDVYNSSAQVSDTIILDTNLAVVTTTAPDVTKISKQAGKNICSFSFSSDSPFVEYKVKVVGTSGATEGTGSVLLTTNGSVNVSGVGSYPASTPINVQINGADLELASSGDAVKIIKVFVKEANNTWSI